MKDTYHVSYYWEGRNYSNIACLDTAGTTVIKVGLKLGGNVGLSLEGMCCAFTILGSISTDNRQC